MNDNEDVFRFEIYRTSSSHSIIESTSCFIDCYSCSGPNWKFAILCTIHLTRRRNFSGTEVYWST